MRLERHSEVRFPSPAPPKGQEKGREECGNPVAPAPSPSLALLGGSGARGERGLAQAPGLVEVEVRVH